MRDAALAVHVLVLSFFIRIDDMRHRLFHRLGEIFWGLIAMPLSFLRSLFLRHLARCPRPRTGLGRACCVFAVLALLVLITSAIITPPASHQQAAATPADRAPDMTIIHRMMQDQRAIARATRTYTLSTFAERFGHKGD
jgi:hypothetical protein